MMTMEESDRQWANARPSELCGNLTGFYFNEFLVERKLWALVQPLSNQDGL